MYHAGNRTPLMPSPTGVQPPPPLSMGRRAGVLRSRGVVTPKGWITVVVSAKLLYVRREPGMNHRRRDIMDHADGLGSPEIVSDFHLEYPAKKGPLDRVLTAGGIRFPCLFAGKINKYYVPMISILCSPQPTLPPHPRPLRTRQLRVRPLTPHRAEPEPDYCLQSQRAEAQDFSRP